MKLLNTFYLIMILLVVSIITMPLTFAEININPLKYEIRNLEFNKPYIVMLTAINPDSVQYDVNMMLDSDSYYLNDLVTIEPQFFSLEPNNKKNIKLTLNIPEDISPEEHTLILNFFSVNHKLGNFKLTFNVPGEKKEKLVIRKVNVDNQNNGRVLFFNYNLVNNGNVIASGSPEIDIFKGNDLVHNLGKESKVQVLPNSEYNFTIMYDTVSLEPGEYTYKTKVVYNDNIETNPINGDFKVSNKKHTEESFSERKVVKVGEKLNLNLKINNPNGDGLSFYNVGYIIENSSINNFVEGQIQGSQKDIILDLDTSAFQVGDYKLLLNIKTGRNLENLEKREIIIQVKNDENSLIIIGIVSFCIVFLVILGYILSPYLFEKLKKNNAISNIAIPSDTNSNHIKQKENKPKDDKAKFSLFSKNKSNLNDITLLHNSIIKMHEDVKALHHTYHGLETSMKSFTKEINYFIVDSNNWLTSEGFDYLKIK